MFSSLGGFLEVPKIKREVNKYYIEKFFKRRSNHATLIDIFKFYQNLLDLNES